MDVILRQGIQTRATYDTRLQRNLSILQYLLSNIEKGQEADRCILFCRTYKESTTLFEHLVLDLESSGVLISQALNLDKLRICEKFIACCSSNTRGKIIASFTHPNGIVRIVVGLDSPNVRTVIHWDPPEDLEMYVQETGCSGRDNVLSNAILYYNK